MSMKEFWSVVFVMLVISAVAADSFYKVGDADGYHRAKMEAVKK